jgi:hypothetical protein
MILIQKNKYGLIEKDVVEFINISKGKVIKDPCWIKLYEFEVPTGEYYWDFVIDDWIIVVESGQDVCLAGGFDKNNDNYWVLEE